MCVLAGWMCGGMLAVSAPCLMLRCLPPLSSLPSSLSDGGHAAGQSADLRRRRPFPGQLQASAPASHGRGGEGGAGLGHHVSPSLWRRSHRRRGTVGGYGGGCVLLCNAITGMMKTGRIKINDRKTKREREGGKGCTGV